MRYLAAASLLALLWLSPAQAQNTQCRTAPVGTSSANCASEAFVTQSAAAAAAAAIAALTQTGSWTPTDASGAGLTFTSVSAGYTKIGNMVFAYAALTYPATADGSNSLIDGLPLATANAQYARQCSLTKASTAGVTYLFPTINSTQVSPRGPSNTNLTNASLSTFTLNFNCIYPAS